MATFDDFMKIDVRAGTIIDAKVFKKAKKPAYQLKIDFGEEIGIKNSSAQITEIYKCEDLIGKQILGVVNFPPKQVADFMSEVLVLLRLSFLRGFNRSQFTSTIETGYPVSIFKDRI